MPLVAAFIALGVSGAPEPPDGPPGIPPAASAAAGAPRVRLHWNAPETCGSVERARDSIETLADVELATADPVEAVITVDITQQAQGFAGRVHTLTRDGEYDRVLNDEDCVVLSHALALVAAVALDPVAVVANTTMNEGGTAAVATEVESVADLEVGSELADTPEPAVAPTIASESTSASADSPIARDRSRSLRWPAGLEVGGRAGLGVGGLVLPSAGLIVAGGPYIGTRRVHVHLVGQYVAARRVTLDDDATAGAVLRLATGGVRGCGLIEWQRVRVPLCAGVDAGAVLAEGVGDGLVKSHSVRAPWIGVVLSPGVTFAVARNVSLWLAFEGVISLHRPRFHLDRGGELERIGRFGPRGMLGIELHAPRSVRPTRKRRQKA